MSLRVPRWFRRSALVAVSLYLLVQTACGPLFYWAPRQRLRVIDYQTHEPVAGAVVAARWITISWGSDHILYGNESITGADGWCEIPAMWPHLRPFVSWLKWRDPSIYVLKEGYFKANMDNSSRQRGAAEDWAYRRVSIWNGRAISIGRAKTAEEKFQAAKDMHMTFASPDFATSRRDFVESWRVIDTVSRDASRFATSTNGAAMRRVP